MTVRESYVLSPQGKKLEANPSPLGAIRPLLLGASSVKFSKLFSIKAPVAQLDRVSDYESGGRRFESFRVRHFP